MLNKSWFHGTNKDFNEFVKDGDNRMAQRADAGFWFTENIDEAEEYGSIIKEVNLISNKPYTISERELDFIAVSEPVLGWVKVLKSKGYDSLYIPAREADIMCDISPHSPQLVVFNSDQIEIMQTITRDISEISM